ncbi:MAG: P-loop NTPase [Hyphomicrobiales bacterium]
MSDAVKDAVKKQLSLVKGPDLKGDLMSLDLVSDIFVTGEKVMFSISVPAERAEELEPLRKAAESAVLEVDGINKVTAVLTAEKTGGSGAPAPAQPKANPQSNPMAAPPSQQAEAAKAGVPGVKHIIAVASGKGGVGKSTTSINLALGLSALGHEVGVLDADIYGPSMPRLLGLTGRPEAEGRLLHPMENFGIKVMSMGFLVEEETPMIWRGPMVISALTQMLREVAWGELDVLVVDMPPGTGDAQLTMAQQVPLSGAVIVSTPQDLALIDARKGLNMFRKVDVPLLGLIENMSYFICPSCNERSDIFGHGGAKREAERIGVPFLGEVPLHMSIRETSDSGAPIVVSEPSSAHAEIYRDIAAQVWETLEGDSVNAPKSAPKIVFE